MRSLICFAFVLTASALLAQPVIDDKGVRSAAATAASSGLARGSAFLINGSGLGPADDFVKTNPPYPQELAGTQVRVIGKDTDVSYDVYITEVSSRRVRAILPSSIPAGEYQLVVTTPDGASEPAPLLVVESNPGIVTTTGFASGLAVAAAYPTDDVPYLIKFTSPARPGQRIVIDAAGFGPIGTPDNDLAPEQPAFDAAEVLINGMAAPIIYAGRHPEKPGFDRIVLDLPASELPEGCFVSITFRAGDAISNPASLAIAKPGDQTCTHPAGISPEGLRKIDEGDVVITPSFELSDLAFEMSYEGQTFEFHTRSAGGGFYQYDRYAMESGFWPNGSLTINGCSVYTVSGDEQEFSPIDISAADAGGELLLTRNGQRALTLNRQPDNIYTADLSGGLPSFPGFPSAPSPFQPGSFTLQGQGGVIISPFVAALEVSEPVTWTNKDVVNEVSRLDPLTVTWTAGLARDLVIISGFAGVQDPETEKTRGAAFTCSAPADRGHITVPADILRLMPVTRNVENGAGFFSFLHTSQPPNGSFQAGLVAGGKTETGAISFTFGTQKSATYF
jgi:uncharacterized protein (TIGR03437 family)